MDNQDIVNNLQLKNVLRIEKKEADESITCKKPIKEVDTQFVGKIVLLEIGNNLIAKEEDGNGSIYLRIINTIENFDAFTQDRLSVYDRMWDGCGCKVDYNKVWNRIENKCNCKDMNRN